MTTSVFVVLGLLLLFSAAIAAAEAAILSINKVRLRHLVEQGHPGAKATFTLLLDLDHLISTLLLANNLVQPNAKVPDAPTNQPCAHEMPGPAPLNFKR